MEFRRNKKTGITEVYLVELEEEGDKPVLFKDVLIASIHPENYLGIDKWVVKFPESKSTLTTDSEVIAMGTILQAAVGLSNGIIKACESDQPRVVHVG